MHGKSSASEILIQLKSLTSDKEIAMTTPHPTKLALRRKKDGKEASVKHPIIEIHKILALYPGKYPIKGLAYLASYHYRITQLKECQIADTKYFVTNVKTRAVNTYSHHARKEILINKGYKFFRDEYEKHLKKINPRKKIFNKDIYQWVSTQLNNRNSQLHIKCSLSGIWDDLLGFKPTSSWLEKNLQNHLIEKSAG